MFNASVYSYLHQSTFIRLEFDPENYLLTSNKVNAFFDYRYIPQLSWKILHRVELSHIGKIKHSRPQDSTGDQPLSHLQSWTPKLIIEMVNLIPHWPVQMTALWDGKNKPPNRLKRLVIPCKSKVAPPPPPIVHWRAEEIRSPLDGKIGSSLGITYVQFTRFINIGKSRGI